MSAKTLYFADLTPDTPYRDANGKPLAQARLTFWRSRTTAHAPVYSDPGLETEIEQPIEADSSGVFPSIYLDSTIDYRVLLHSDDGVLRFDVDPYVHPIELEEHTQHFTTGGTSVVQAFDVPEGVESVDVLVVGAGGRGNGSGITSNGGGGGGGVRWVEGLAVTPGSSVSVVVGRGSARRAGVGEGLWVKGEASSFGDIVAEGGGRGGASGSDAGRDGGSGGGTTSGTPGQGIDGQGYPGAAGTSAVTGGGGGGAGGPGQAGTAGKAGDGGSGVYFGHIFGDEVGEQGWFAAGGAANIDGIGGVTPGQISLGHGASTGGGGSSGSQVTATEDSSRYAGNNGFVGVRWFQGKSNIYLSPIYRPFADNVLPGAELKFFADGEIADTFADAELAIKHPHPIRADAGGAFPPIYLGDEQSAYTVQLKDRHGNVIFGPSDNPAPAIGELDPASVIEGKGEFTLTVTGTGFVSSSVVRWGTDDLATAFVSDTELAATVPAEKADIAGYALVSVFNPVPIGGLSNYLKLTIRETPNPVPEIGVLDPSSIAEGSSAFTLTVHGDGFIDGSVVRWDGSDRSTTFIDETELEAQIVADDVAEVGAAEVTVFNPTPGGGESEPETFTITSASDNFVVFTASDTWTVPEGVTQVSVLIVAGGGGGSAPYGGGGGGGVLYAEDVSVTPDDEIAIVVGAGGPGATFASGGVDGSSGGNSSFGDLIAFGGGGGGRNNGLSGGSGGGAGRATAQSTGGSGTAGQGNSGGNSSATGGGNIASGGGGGGAGGAGQNGGNGVPGAGGVGLEFPEFASFGGSPPGWFGGGGGGGGASTPSGGGSGGAGGGASGSNNTSTPTAATANTGGGGGGGGWAGGNFGSGGAGGSGIVIVRYSA